MYTSSTVTVTLDDRGKRKGIKAVAKQLGVSYTHLYLVLAKKRISVRLLNKVKQSHPELIS